MRVAYYTDTREIGGAEQNLVDMARAAIAAGHAVTLLAPQAELVDWMAARTPGAAARVVGDDAYFDAPTQARRGALLAAGARRIGRALRDADIELLHVNNGGFPGSDLCRLAPAAARLAGVRRRLMTVHSNPWPRERSGDVRVQAAADGLVWRTVEAVTCPSQAVADGLVERRGAPRSLLRPLHYGVAAPAAAAEDVAAVRERLAPNGELLVGMVSARPVPEKGYDVFLEAIAQAGEGVRGALVGPVPGDGFRERAEAAAGARLVLEGEVRPIGPHYQAFDLVVVPSVAEECMPLVILEAMAAGTPVAGSRLSGIPEAIVGGETGWVFPIGDAEALAGVLRDAAAARERLPAMGAAGRERWERLFQPDVMATALRALYDGARGTAPA